MDDQVFTNGLTFGKAGLTDLLALARPAMADAESCDRLYTLARSAVLRLLRCDRDQGDLDSWTRSLKTIAALARGSYETMKGDQRQQHGYLLMAETRFETLSHLLDDQGHFKAYYGIGSILTLPFVERSVMFLFERNSPVPMSDYLTAMGIKKPFPIVMLAELGLVLWDETEKDTITIWLSSNGRLLAKDFETQARLVRESLE